MKIRPKVSVLVPVYNVEPYLRQCLDSIIRQSFRNIEVICIDDGSTDHSLEILREYEARDRRVRVIAKAENEGLLSARRSGVAAAKGEYILFVDSDDTLDPELCNEIYPLACGEQADILQFSIQVDPCGASDPKILSWFTVHLQPQSETLLGKQILEDCYVRQAHFSSLLGKLYRTSLCRQAYDAIPDMYCYLGEDILCYFFLSYYASKYVGAPTQAKYHYYYGRGISNDYAVPLQKFEHSCRMSLIAKTIKGFLEKEESLETFRDAYRKVSVRMCTDGCRTYLNRVSELDKRAALRMLFSAWRDNRYAEESFQNVLGKDYITLSKMLDIPEFIQRGGYIENGGHPKVSVIIPVYNVEKYLPACLDSIVDQTLKDIEIICVNDGSLDGSLDILREYAGRDDRITVISQKNGGLSAARNAGLDEAHGEYIQFCDSDDSLERNALKELYQTAADDRLDIIYFDAATQYETAWMKEQHSEEERYYKGAAHISTVCTGRQMMKLLREKGMYRACAYLQMLRAGFLRQAGERFCEGIIHEDEPFTFATMLQAQRVRKQDKDYYIRLFRNGSIVTSPTSFSSPYGCLKGLMLMIEFSANNVIEPPYQDATCSVMKSLCYGLQRRYGQLDDDEKRKVSTLHPLEKFWLDLILSPQSPPKSSGIISAPAGPDEAALIRASASYKIGRAITFFPRKLRGGVRCLRENGLSYTLRRITHKIRGLFGGK